MLFAMHGFTTQELRFLRPLTSPAKIQDFLDTIPMSFDEGEYLSPRRVLRERKAQCMEGAMLAAVALRMIGYPPFVMDLKTGRGDVDHVVAVFKQDSCWGAISKTNHSVLRYREPIYKNIRELAVSYFHEYFLNDGRKTLRSYSRPVNLSRFDRRGWMTSEDDVAYIPEYIDAVHHFSILTPSQITRLRKADPIERKMGRIVEWTRGKGGRPR
jgi:hypothetical protein